MSLAEWFEQFEAQGMRHTRALPPASRWERLYRRIFGVNHPRVVERRMEALYRDEQEQAALRRELKP
jgi:hypothetical protein